MIQPIFSKTCILGLVVLVSGCASVPVEPLIVHKNANEVVSQTYGTCDDAKLHQNQVTATTTSHVLDADKITLLNWNVYKGQGENWLGDFLKHSDGQDLVLLQEAQLDPNLQKALQNKQLNWQLNTAFFLNDKQTGVMTASTVKAVYSCGLRTSEPLIRLPKTTLISRFHISGSKSDLLVANIHGINFSLGTESYEQQISAMTNVLTRHSGPVIVAGDFNNWSDERTAIVDEMVSTLGLRPVVYKNSNRITIFGNSIDHIYYRGLRQLTQETIKVSSSDHNPMKVTFTTADLSIARSHK